jgi:hypothetical protein
MPASRLWSLLLEVFERRAARQTAPGLLRQWDRDRFTQPAAVDQRTLVALDASLLAAAPAFEAIELSPLAPLGACSVVAPASQNKIVSALRGTEVVSDPTNALALECARRLRRDPGRVVRLASCHRCVRAQPVPRLPGFAQHFRMFCLAVAGREGKDHGLAVEAIVELVAVHLAAFDRLEGEGYAFPRRQVTLLASPARAPLAARIAERLPQVTVVHGALEHPYYDGLRFMISAGARTGDDIALADGGLFDWVRRLASNRRLVFIASGMGAQLAAALYRPDA